MRDDSATAHPRLLTQIRAAGATAGVALNPSTPLDVVRHVIDLVDIVLVMTVNPGWGGQSRRAPPDRMPRSPFREGA